MRIRFIENTQVYLSSKKFVNFSAGEVVTCHVEKNNINTYCKIHFENGEHAPEVPYRCFEVIDGEFGIPQSALDAQRAVAGREAFKQEFGVDCHLTDAQILWFKDSL